MHSAEKLGFLLPRVKRDWISGGNQQFLPQRLMGKTCLEEWEKRGLTEKGNESGMEKTSLTICGGHSLCLSQIFLITNNNKKKTWQSLP